MLKPQSLRYVFKQCCIETRLKVNKKIRQQSKEPIFGPVKLDINLTRKRFQQIHCTLNKNLILCLGIKTHDALLKPFFVSLCFIWYLQKFSWLSIKSSNDPFWPQLTAYCFLCYVFYNKCYLFLKGSPSCSCPLHVHKPVHLGQGTEFSLPRCH